MTAVQLVVEAQHVDAGDDLTSLLDDVIRGSLPASPHDSEQDVDHQLAEFFFLAILIAGAFLPWTLQFYLVKLEKKVQEDDQELANTINSAGKLE